LENREIGKLGSGFLGAIDRNRMQSDAIGFAFPNFQISKFPNFIFSFQFSIFNFQFSILNFQFSIFNFQFSIFNFQF